MKNILLYCLFILAPFSLQAWYVPCFCGCGLPIEYMVSVQHVNQYALQGQKTAQLVETLQSSMSQLQTMIKTYNNIKETYDAIGRLQNLVRNFDFSRIASTWKVEDWNDLKDLGKRLGYSTKDWDTNSGDNEAGEKTQTEISFLASLLKDASNVTGETKTDLDSLNRNLRDVNGFNSDSAIRTIIAQETRNSQLKARAAVAAQQVKSTPEVMSSADGGIQNDSATIIDSAESSVISKSVETALWSDMTNSINRSTMMRLQSVDAYVESKRNAILKEQTDNLFKTD